MHTEAVAEQQDALLIATRDMERAMVGALMLDPAKLARVAAMVRPEDVLNPPARAVYESIRFLGADNQPVDAVLVLDDLRKRGLSGQVGGAGGLAALVDAATSGENAEFYAAKVADAARERRQREAVENAYLAMQGGAAPATVVAELREDLDAAQAASGRNLEAKTVAEIIADWQQGNSLQPSIATMYEQWDLLHGGGLAAGDLTIVAAAPSVGKSQFVINLEARMERDGKPARVLHISAEMPKIDIVARQIGMLGHLNSTTARVMLRGVANDYTWDTNGWAFDSGKQLAEKLPVRIIHGAFKPDDLKALASRYAGRFDVMVVDYLQRISGEKEQKTLDRVAAACKTCKDIAMTHDVHVIAVSSLNREGYRPGSRPTLSSLRETGDIEFDADNVWMLWREKQKGVNEEELQVSIEKQRNGPLDMIAFNFELTTGIITEKRKRDDE